MFYYYLGLKIQNTKKNNKINQNYISLIEQTKEGFYYKSKFENKKFF